MLVSKEVLISICSKVILQNLDEIVEITDLDHVQRKTNLKFNDKSLYWLDMNGLTLNYLENKKGIFLFSEDHFQKLDFNKLQKLKLVVTNDPSLLFFTLAELLCNTEIVPVIHPTATVHPKSKLGNNIYIGPGAVIDLCEIGDNCIIHSNCSIGNGVKIGNNTVIHSGAKIGFNIFSFKQNPKGVWMKYQQIAGVSIGNNVTIGSNTCINNGFITNTIISDNSFVDSLCQIQGSVIIEEKTIIAAGSFLATNVKIGKRCWISPNTSIRENVTIADDVFVGIGSVVLRNIKKPCRVFGNPVKILPTD